MTGAQKNVLEVTSEMIADGCHGRVATNLKGSKNNK